jgi:hypothetical protein
MKRAQTAQHVFAALMLFNAGYQHLHHNPVFAACQIIAAALLVGSVVVEKFRHGHASTKGIAWVELAGAVLSFIEAIEKLHQPHHTLFYVLIFVQPLVLLAFALFDAQIGRSRYIRLDDAGLEFRIRLIWRTRIAWDAIRGYRRTGNAIDFGERRIKLNDVVDRDGAADWLIEALKRRGVAELPA